MFKGSQCLRCLAGFGGVLGGLDSIHAVRDRLLKKREGAEGSRRAWGSVLDRVYGIYQGFMGFYGVLGFAGFTGFVFLLFLFRVFGGIGFTGYTGLMGLKAIIWC